jgi:hypothetical protein
MQKSESTICVRIIGERMVISYLGFSKGYKEKENRTII